MSEQKLPHGEVQMHSGRSWVTENMLRELPRRVLTLPLAPGQVPIDGIVAKMYLPELEIWHLHALSDGSPELLARLLALLLLDSVEPVLQQRMMPERPPMALISNGEIREGRGRVMAPWVLREVARIASTIRAQHPEYLDALSGALRQEVNAEFGPVPPDVPLGNPYPSMRLGSPPPEVEVDISGSERVRFGLAWHEVETQDYVRNRYLAPLTQEQLGRRTEDIVSNLHVLDPNGLVSFDPDDPTLSYWLGRLNEIQVEMALRHGPYPAGWTRGMIDFERMPSSLRAAGPGASVRLVPAKPLGSPVWAKYGQRKYMEAALTEGKIRVAPASFYDDASLNTAVRDDELTAEIWCDPRVPFTVAPPGSVVYPVTGVPVRLRLSSNYYVYCLADRLSTRLLFDFEADACLLIREPDTFLKRVRHAMEDQLPGWHFISTEVEYFDPLQVQPAEVDVLTAKHFRYAYQEEVRLAWVPPTPIHRLDPVFLTLGSLEDIAEIVLPQTADPPTRPAARA
jgi:hypothetical protein